MYRGGRRQHVSSVAKRWQVAHGHVTERGGAEVSALVVQAF